ncbi:Gfo/Idh/MocA family oxidoreductase [Aeromicrobium sp.]|uniref:Gfo/Idh/MocA family protein n=1 Tax=Aeromicrobium sp. TaxID=1871063 RepID=UPI0019A4E2BF|nr:Gfo/Idh/MocA family oxidoreductase [Aeromicrobium sp.]MBC7631980.1 Gfo/Idh/MocA family oxidoreductase [Aeromicrobium sp.]
MTLSLSDESVSEESPQVTPIRWGILATGKIAATFATDLALVPGSVLAAVGSRHPEAAREFAERFGGARAHGSYEDLAADDEVDVIYVATPHGRHLEDVMTCFEAGKAVLCEKALTMNVADTETLVAEARSRRLFFAEAMWMRANPNIRRIRQMVEEGACGQIRQVRAELGFVAPRDRARLWDPALGASALLDVGIYPLTFAHLVLGEPEAIVAAGTLSGGIDVNAGATMTYASGAVANIAWNQVARSDNRASIAGDGGLIEVPARFHHPTAFSYTQGAEGRGGPVETIGLPVTGRGYAHEIEEVASCLRAGATESALLPLDETVSLMRQMADILHQLGVAPR